MTNTTSRIADGNLISRIQQVRADLEQCLRDNDWQRIAELDEKLRELIGRAVDELTQAESREALRDQLQDLQNFYQKIVTQGTEVRDQLGRELQQLRKSAAAANQYLKSGGYPQ